MTYESKEKKSRRGRALGVVVATAVAAAPSLGCTDEVEPLPTDATASAADGSSTMDAGSSTDGSLAMDTGSQADTSTGPEDTDADVDDAYPYGVRG